MKTFLGLSFIYKTYNVTVPDPIIYGTAYQNWTDATGEKIQWSTTNLMPHI
jgi:hypothetical protein